MEDEKLAEYYDDLTRRGGGAARFKQGLGFSADAESSHDAPPSRGSALPSSSSFLSSFVRASSSSKTSELEKQAQLNSIQNKLSKNPNEKIHSSRRSSRSRSRDRDTDYKRIRRSRSRERDYRRRSRSREGRSRRNRSREITSRGRHQSRSRSRDRDSERTRRRRSPEEPKNKDKNGGKAIDFSKLIKGYDSMTPAQRVKAKMKLQLSETAENDEMLGKGSGWERFEFNKDAPLDDEEVEAAEDDAEIVKHMKQSFRFTAVEARREQEIKSVHDAAIFGGTSFPLPTEMKQEDASKNENASKSKISSLLSDQIVKMQQKGSWRDRVGET